MEFVLCEVPWLKSNQDLLTAIGNFRAYTNGMKGSIPDDIGGAWKIGESNGLLGLLNNLVCCGFCTQLFSCINTYRKPLPPRQPVDRDPSIFDTGYDKIA
jgi:hypothetical protein